MFDREPTQPRRRTLVLERPPAPVELPRETRTPCRTDVRSRHQRHTGRPRGRRATFIAVQHAGLHDGATSADTGDTEAGEKDTGPGKASAPRRSARQALTG